MSIAAWTQYVLDSFVTFEEAVAEMRKEPFCTVAAVDRFARASFYINASAQSANP
ncbi:hypothetical protein SH139x_005128 [Planctomycetaceae bacterium SH139]